MLVLNCFFLSCCLYWHFASTCNPWAVKGLHRPLAKALLSSEERAAWLHATVWKCTSEAPFCSAGLFFLALTLLPSVHPALLAALLHACLEFLDPRKSFAQRLQLQQHVQDDACTGGSGWGLGFHQNTAVQRPCWKRTDSQQEGLRRSVQINGNFYIQIKLCYCF